MSNIVDLSDAGGGDTRIVKELVALSKMMKALVRLRLAEIGLQPGEDDVLIAMSGDRIASVSAIASELFVRFETMLRLVDQLVAKGHVERIAGPLIRLSANGARLLSQIERSRDQIAKDLGLRIGSIETDRVTEVLSELNKRLLSTLGTRDRGTP